MTQNENTSINQIIENLISIHPLLSKTFTRSLRSKSNLNPGSLYVLGVLTRHGKLSMSDIGCKLSMPKPHITALVDKLIAEEMVERLFDTKDRRIVYVQITEKGIKDFNAIKIEISQEIREKLQFLDAEKLEAFSISSKQVKDNLMAITVDTRSSSTACKSEQTI